VQQLFGGRGVRGCKHVRRPAHEFAHESRHIERLLRCRRLSRCLDSQAVREAAVLGDADGLSALQSLHGGGAQSFPRHLAMQAVLQSRRALNKYKGLIEL
jgi:hypothetical protein